MQNLVYSTDDISHLYDTSLVAGGEGTGMGSTLSRNQ